MQYGRVFFSHDRRRKAAIGVSKVTPLWRGGKAFGGERRMNCSERRKAKTGHHGGASIPFAIGIVPATGVILS
jgi:hypothetical protein